MTADLEARQRATVRARRRPLICEIATEGDEAPEWLQSLSDRLVGAYAHAVADSDGVVVLACLTTGTIAAWSLLSITTITVGHTGSGQSAVDLNSQQAAEWD